MNNLDREIEQLERRLEHLRTIRERRNERLYQSSRWGSSYDSYDDGNYFPLILMGLVFALLLFSG